MANKLKQRKKNEKSNKEENDDSDSGTGIPNHNTETSLDNNVSLGVQNAVNSQELNYCSDNKNEKALCNGSESKTKKNMCTKNDQLCNKHSSMMKCQDKSAFFNHDCKPPAINFEVDFAAVVLFVIGICTRMWRLEEPKSIVFDELHYGKFVSMYMNRTFFFDTHPPLGKQLIALAGYLYGYNGENDFYRIGGDYQDSVPIHVLRAVPAFFGSLLIPTVYYLVRELGFTSRTAMLAGFLLIFENSYLTQSRFILMESMLIWFSTFGLLAYLKFRNSSRAFSLQWCGWLFMCSLSLSCAICVKYSGLFTAVLVVGLLVVDYWKMIADHSLNVRQLLLHLITRVQAVFVVPILVYLLVFYIHLEVLIRAGPYDNVMTSAFQASLEGGLSSITKGQPLVVAHGSQVTLRHTHGRTCWLHSHPHVYPVRYRDQRGSSHQQQVTCYSFKDVNNWWIIKRPDVPELVASDPIDKIKHGDIIQLVHGMTIRTLNSHDVAAPMSPQNQEVSCYIDYNISFPAQDLWKVDITNRDSEGDVWNTIHSHVRLIHVNSGQALKFSGKQLPDWGFNQHEIVTDRVVNQYDTVWNVEEHRYTTKSDQKEREREIGMAEFVPLQPTKLSFFEKMWELQFKMLTSNSENVPDHIYSSEAMDWLFMTRGIAYWISHKSNAQIHLLGNIITWYTATLAVAFYCCIFVFYMLRRRRQFYDIPDEVWNNFCVAGQVCFSGYLLNFLPYFFVDHVMFLHHYLPAYFFKLLLLVTFIEHISSLVCLIPNSFIHKLIKISFMVAICIWVAAIMYTFNLFTALCYGTMPLTAEQVLKLRWKDTWDFIVHVT